MLCAGIIADKSKLPQDVPYAPSREAFTELVTGVGWANVAIPRYGDPELNFGRYPQGREPDASQCLCTAEWPSDAGCGSA